MTSMHLSKLKLVLFTIGLLVLGGFLGALTQQKLAITLGGISSEAKIAEAGQALIEMTSLAPSRSLLTRSLLIQKAIFPIKSSARSFRGGMKLRLRSVPTPGRWRS